MVYETYGRAEDGGEHRLYTGTDPVAAVDAGLRDTDHLVTWVTEDGVIVPGTVAA